jgi:O-antigen ligase
VNVAQTQATIMPSAPLNFPARPAQGSPHRLATGVLLVYLFLVMSRAVEMIPTLIGVDFRLALLLLIFLMVAALFSGGLLECAKTPVVLMFTALTCWLMLAVLTSQWHGGSVMTLKIWATSYACALIVPSLVSNLDQCRKVFYAFGFALVPILLATVLFQAQIEGRDNTAFGTLANPNDLAFSLLLLVPFAVFVIGSESLFSWKTIVCTLAIVFALIKTLRTGSRAGMLTMLLCVVIVFFSGKMKTKVKMLVVAGLVATIAFALIPATVLHRYATVFNGTEEEAGMTSDEQSAVASTRARKMLFQESVRVMMEYPLLGVGPGIFSAALAKEQEKRGEHQTWHEAHNSYTQLGSEAGIPALVIYLAALIYCLKRTVSIYRAARRDPNQIMISRMAASLFMALVIYGFCAALGTYTYGYQLPVLAGLVQALDVCVRREKRTAPANAPASFQTRWAAPAFSPRLGPQLNSQVSRQISPQLNRQTNPQAPNYVRNRRLPHGRA